MGSDVGRNARTRFHYNAVVVDVFERRDAHAVRTRARRLLHESLRTLNVTAVWKKALERVDVARQNPMLCDGVGKEQLNRFSLRCPQGFAEFEKLGGSCAFVGHRIFAPRRERELRSRSRCDQRGQVRDAVDSRSVHAQQRNCIERPPKHAPLPVRHIT
jgi:hypothetical protein